MSVATVMPAEIKRLLESGKRLNLLDVRTPVEFADTHIAGASNVPLDQLNPAKLGAEGGGPIYVVCRSGGRAAKAAEKLLGAGLTEVFSIEGGMQAWEAAGLPVERGRKSISLERQVRIAAGSLVLIGVVLGFLVHRVFFGLSGFVGAGLVFAGVTDTCAMGMLIAKAPWNRTPPGSGGPACGAAGSDRI